MESFEFTGDVFFPSPNSGVQAEEFRQLRQDEMRSNVRTKLFIHRESAMLFMQFYSYPLKLVKLFLFFSWISFK